MRPMPRVSAAVKESTRSRLLESAAREFAEFGVERANIDRVSIGAGFAKGTIYNYFASKEALFGAVVESACEAAVEHARPRASGSPRERIVAVLDSFVTWAAANESFARVLVRECLGATPGLQGALVGAEQPLVGALTQMLTEGAETRRVRDDLAPDLLALALASLTDLALAYHWAQPGAIERSRIPELVVQVVLGPLAAAGHP